MDANESGLPRGGFTEGHLRDMLRRYRPEAYQRVSLWAPEQRADFYDRLGRAYAAALDRALLYGTERDRQAQART